MGKKYQFLSGTRKRDSKSFFLSNAINHGVVRNDLTNEGLEQRTCVFSIHIGDITIEAINNHTGFSSINRKEEGIESHIVVCLWDLRITVSHSSPKKT